MVGRAAYRIHWLGILLAIIATDACAQTNGANAKIITWQSASANSEVYVGILGEVHKPGVYHLDAHNLSLQNIIRRAGGMVEEASGTIRIVRQDRVVESLFFNPNVNVSVLPGDLLIIESKRTQAAISKMYDSDPRMRAMYANSEAANRPSSSSGVQVAFVNVLDRPVIVKLKHEFAHIGHVVQMLDQPVELAQAVRVIGPERMLTQSAAPQPIDAALADGSVLVFPRNAINRSKLPAFPVPYESEIASGAMPSLIGGATGQSPELRNVGQLPPMMARQSIPATQFSQPAADPITIPTAPVINSQPPVATERLEIPQPIQTPVVSTPPRIATIPFTGERRITSSSRQLPTTPESVELPKQPKLDAEEASTPKTSRSATKKPTFEEPSLSDDEVIPDEELDTAESGKSGGLSIWLLLSITAISGLLIGVAIWARRYFDGKLPIGQGLIAEIDAVLQQHSGKPLAKIDTIPQASAPQNLASPEVETKLPTPAPLISGTSVWFDQLLKNQLPIHEEKIEFPTEIALQGRIIPPPVLRLDAASEPLEQGPHFAAEAIPVQSDASLAEMTGDTARSIDQADLAHGKRPPKPHFLGRRAGENTIAAAAMSAKAMSAPEIKSSTTPVADALRHLQGGQT